MPDLQENAWVDMDLDFEEEEDDEDEVEDTDPYDSKSYHGGREYIMAEEANPFSAADFEDFRRHPAILRTNKQIYSEASSLMYTEGTIVIHPGDIFSLKGGTSVLPFGARGRSVWKHNPLKGMGKEKNYGTVKYETPKAEGLMYPHVFSRFEKVFFDANFDLNHTHFFGFWMDDDTLEMRADDAKESTRVLRRSSVIKDFVKFLSQSRRITNLEIVLELEVSCHSNLMDEATEDMDDEEEEELDERIDMIQAAANEKATGLFLDSGICKDLLHLKNVRKFEWTFGTGFEMGQEFHPTETDEKMLRDMKQEIEGNFME